MYIIGVIVYLLLVAFVITNFVLFFSQLHKLSTKKIDLDVFCKTSLIFLVGFLAGTFILVLLPKLGFIL